MKKLSKYAHEFFACATVRQTYDFTVPTDKNLLVIDVSRAIHSRTFTKMCKLEKQSLLIAEIIERSQSIL